MLPSLDSAQIDYLTNLIDRQMNVGFEGDTNDQYTDSHYDDASDYGDGETEYDLGHSYVDEVEVDEGELWEDLWNRCGDIIVGNYLREMSREDFLNIVENTINIEIIEEGGEVPSNMQYVVGKFRSEAEELFDKASEHQPTEQESIDSFVTCTCLAKLEARGIKYEDIKRFVDEQVQFVRRTNPATRDFSEDVEDELYIAVNKMCREILYKDNYPTGYVDRHPERLRETKNTLKQIYANELEISQKDAQRKVDRLEQEINSRMREMFSSRETP